VITIPMAAVAAALPDTLASAVRSKAGVLRLDRDLVLPQLTRGKVCLSLRELIQAAPPGAVVASPDQLETQVSLPLEPILTGIPAELWQARAGRRKTILPSDIADLFGPRGAAPAPLSTDVASFHASPDTRRPLPESPSPVAAASFPSSQTAIKFPQPPSFPPLGDSAPKPATDQPGAFVSLPSASERLPVIAASAPALPPAADALVVPLSQLCADWPEAIRGEIVSNGWLERSARLPLDKIEAGLKAGRISFTWAEISCWVAASENPPAPAVAQTVLILPLPVVAPLFFARKRPARPARPVVSIEGIPDLFPAPKPAPVSVAPPPPPAAVPLEDRAPPPSVSRPPVSPSEVRLSPETIPIHPPPARRDPGDFVEEAARLPGVAGALLASEDGLLIAARFSPEISPDKLAAFLPSVLGKIHQLGLDLGLGVLREARFDWAGRWWSVARTGNLLLVVAAASGQPLPDQALRALREELKELTS
jgi:predicted regulator of Ras-like GTPase activity (Roadblock/LC7/MglB family)